MTESGRWSYQAAWPPDPRHVADARHFVGWRLHENGLSPHVDTVTLVVSELAANAVVHAATPFTVTLERSPRGLRLAVKDGSQGIFLGSALMPWTQSRGRGLRIVAALSSSWGVTTQADGKSVWAVFALPGSADEHCESSACA